MSKKTIPFSFMFLDKMGQGAIIALDEMKKLAEFVYDLFVEFQPPPPPPPEKEVEIPTFEPEEPIGEPGKPQIPK